MHQTQTVANSVPVVISTRGQLVNHILEMAKRCSEEGMLMTLYWQGTAQRIRLRWHRIGRALPKRGTADGLELAKSCSEEVFPN